MSKVEQKSEEWDPEGSDLGLVGSDDESEDREYRYSSEADSDSESDESDDAWMVRKEAKASHNIHRH